MYNNTFTSTETYNLFSSITEKKENIAFKPRTLSIEESIFNYGYLYSIELNRSKIFKDISENFEFASHHEEIDFLAANQNLLKVLPTIGNYIKNNFDQNSRLTLELLSEEKDWNTLFINIYTSLDWEKSNQFIDTFLDNLFELYPEISTKLNVNIIPNEF